MLTRTELEMVCSELIPRCVGGQVQRVRQPNPDTIILRIRHHGASVRLVISGAPGAARVAEAEADGATMERTTALGDWVRSVARGRPLQALELDEQDRIVRLVFPEGILCLEAIGARTNLLGVSVDSRVVVASRPRALRQGLEIGGLYVPPSAPPRRDDPTPRFANALAVEAHARSLVELSRDEQEKRLRTKMLTQASRRLRRLRVGVERDRENCRDAEHWRRLGELLKGHLHQVKHGDSQVGVTDWFSEGMPTITLELDPRSTGPENVERFFRRYRKAVNGRDRVEARIQEVEALERELGKIERVEMTNAECRLALVRAGLLPPVQASSKGAKARIRLPYLHFSAANGEDILVGRGGADNHSTTFGVAKGNDHWLHVRDAPGAHVVVPMPARNREPHPETLLDAAALAIHHSRLRGEPRVGVSHTRRKHVKPVKGGPPGRVSMADARTIEVQDPEPRIRRLYADRLR